MSDPVFVCLVLCVAAMAAGAVNAVAGGGTLLSFPPLLRLMEAVNANATSTVALLPGSLAGGFGYRQEVRECRALIFRLLAPSVLGGVVGSLLVTRLPPKVFATLVPWLILVAACLFLIQGPIKRLTGVGKHGPPSLPYPASRGASPETSVSMSVAASVPGSAEASRAAVSGRSAGALPDDEHDASAHVAKLAIVAAVGRARNMTR